MMREAGYTAAEMKSAGYDAKRLNEAGYDVAEACDAGFTAAQMCAAGYAAGGLRKWGYTALDLREAVRRAALGLKPARLLSAVLAHICPLPMQSRSHRPRWCDTALVSTRRATI